MESFWYHEHMNRLSPEEKMMKKALRLARKAETENEVPVGAIVVDENGTIIGRGIQST